MVGKSSKNVAPERDKRGYKSSSLAIINLANIIYNAYKG